MATKGSAGLLILVLLGLFILAILFATTKFIVPNPQTIEESNRIEKDANDAVNKIQQKSIENQSIDVK